MTALARLTDPGTSHAGARDVRKRDGSQKARLLAAYMDAWPFGLTDEEAADRAGLAHIGYWKRCSDLRNEGQIVPIYTGRGVQATRPGRNGSDMMVCRWVGER